jgi:hypothetical protein
VTEHNGTLDGRRVTWTPVVGDVNEMHATARDGGGSAVSTGLLIAIAAAVVALLAGLVLLLARRNRVTTGAAVDTDDGGGTDGVTASGDAGAFDPEPAGDTKPLDVTVPPEEVAVPGEPGEPGEAPSRDRPAGV